MLDKQDQSLTVKKRLSFLTRNKSFEQTLSCVKKFLHCNGQHHDQTKQQQGLGYLDA